MKTRFISLSAALTLGCLSFGTLDANNIGYVEKFSLAKDRAEALKQLIPGTRDYYYYHALHAQHRGDQQELNRILASWINRHGHTGRVKEIRNRQTLLNFEKNPAGTVTYLRNELGLNFHHSRVIEGQKPRFQATQWDQLCYAGQLPSDQ